MFTWPPSFRQLHGLPPCASSAPPAPRPREPRGPQGTLVWCRACTWGTSYLRGTHPWRRGSKRCARSPTLPGARSSVSTQHIPRYSRPRLLKLERRNSGNHLHPHRCFGCLKAVTTSMPWLSSRGHMNQPQKEEMARSQEPFRIPISNSKLWCDVYVMLFFVHSALSSQHSLTVAGCSCRSRMQISFQGFRLQLFLFFALYQVRVKSLNSRIMNRFFCMFQRCFEDL